MVRGWILCILGLDRYAYRSAAARGESAVTEYEEGKR